MLYPKYKLHTLKLPKSDELIDIEPWVLCILFVKLTSIYNNESYENLLQMLTDEMKDVQFITSWNEICLKATSVTANNNKMILSRTVGVKENTQLSSVNRTLEIMHNIVKCCCDSIQEDEKSRLETLYKAIKRNSRFDTIKKHIKISMKIANETVLKLWNQLDYELRLNNKNNREIIFRTQTNIMYCVMTHYKYLLYVYMDILQNISKDADNSLSPYVMLFMSLVEKHEVTIKNITAIGDEMDDVIKLALSPYVI